MFERFSDEAKRVIVVAQEQARWLRHTAIEVDDLLHGVLDSPSGVAFGVTTEQLAAETTRGVGADGALPFSRHAKVVLEDALRESIRMRHALIASGHIGAALLKQDRAVELLGRLAVDLQQLPTRLRDAIQTEIDAAGVAPSAPAVRDTEASEACPECGEDLTTNRRHETRRVPNPEGGRGSITARVVLCGACGAMLGPG